MASQYKTPSSALVIAAVIVVFCLAVTSPALARPESQGTENASSQSSTTSQVSEGAVLRADDQFKLLIVLVALAGFIRLRIEWSKKLVRRSHRWLVIPMLVVEFSIAGTTCMLVYLMFPDLHGLPVPAWLVPTILWAFVGSIVWLFLLLLWQLGFDIRWMCCKRPSVLSGFLSVKAMIGQETRWTMIRVADVVRLERARNRVTTMTLRVGDQIKFRKPRLL